MTEATNRKRLVRYRVFDRVVHERWSDDLSELHVVDGRDYVLFDTKPGSNIDVATYVPVIS